MILNIIGTVATFFIGVVLIGLSYEEKLNVAALINMVLIIFAIWI